MNLPHVRVVIGVLSARCHHARRERCRRTWLVDPFEGVEAFFVVGGATSIVRVADKLELPCPDDYPSLPQKTAWLLQYALESFAFDYLFKCDDDTYVSIPRLMTALSSVEYSGNDLGGYASGGAGYLLRRDAARRILSRLRAHRTGDEDVLVGRSAREVGITLTPNGRFRAWSVPNEVPQSDNDLITAHPVRDDLMERIHAGLRDAPAMNPSNRLFEVESWSTDYGVIGLEGNRGFSVDGSTRLDTGRVDFDLAPYATISAHASSTVAVVTKAPSAIRGFTDSAAFDLPNAPIAFEVDGHLVGTVHAPGRRTPEIALAPGRHTLRAICSGDLTRRYSVWALREYRPQGLRIVMVTSNRYVDVARASLSLLDRFWPDHPPVDVVRHEREVEGPVSARQYFAGPQAQLGWAEALLSYLEHEMLDELLLLVLDDYALCAPVNRTGLEAALSVMRADPSIASYLLTWMAAPEKTEYAGRADTVLLPRWSYTVNLQAAVWRRSSLIRILKACGERLDPGELELAATRFFNEHEFETEKAAGANVATPPNPSLFLDGVDKSGWIMPYHNLVRRGVVDARHAIFLQQQGLPVPALLDEP